MTTLRITTALTVAALMSSICVPVLADPLPGQILKFQQLPLNNGQPISPTPPNPIGIAYPGHDEWSTANLLAPGNWQGTFIADDFADNYNTPVVHVRWWGSYDQNQVFGGVKQFLVSFESDLASDPLLNGASRPDQPLLNQIVTLGGLSPGSGTFTENLINGNMQEHLWEYNAELAVPFQQQADTVYWLKIVALVDPATDGPINWGWHDRDWSFPDPYASPNVTPGEGPIGTVVDTTGQPLSVYHFQDDAVSGRVDVQFNAASGLSILQSNYFPENYIYQTPGVVGIDGPFGIQNFSKDLAFELYTIPEPSSIVLVGIGIAALAIGRRRKREKPAA